jgi:hypothetical protein
MGRSKKNYDQLVDKFGNYGIDVINGIFPGQNGNNVKGSKGDEGAVGDKGDTGGPGLRGNKGNAGTDGNDGLKGEKGDLGPALQFDQLTAAQQNLIKGEKGPEGEKGDIHTAPLLNFVGNASNLNTLPAPASDFDTVYVEDQDRYYTYYDGNWAVGGSPVKGQKGERGITGVKGAEGSAGLNGAKGDQGNPGLNGSVGLQGDDGKSAYEVAYDLNPTIGSSQDWLDSLKGEKGVDATAGGDAFDSSNYYDISAIDQLIDGHEVPERAFNYFFHGEGPDNTLSSGDVDFLSTDRFDHLYDAGCILVDNTASVRPNGNPPFSSSDDMLVINYVLRDPSGSRSTQYEVLQFAYARSGQNVYEGYVRRAMPGAADFSEWKPASFNPELYYTKVEVNSLLSNVGVSKEYDIRPSAGLVSGSARVTLNEVGTSNRSDLVLQGLNGIDIYKDGDTIVIDGKPLNGIKYIGPISPDQDPYVKQPSAEIGEFFIYSRAGMAWDGQFVNTGDWAIFSPPISSGSAVNEWVIIFTGTPQGVMTVAAEEPLEVIGTAENPILYLDPDLYFKNESLAETLQPYATWRDLINVARLRSLGSLSDVEVGQDNLGPGGVYNGEVATLPPGPLPGGTFYIDRANLKFVFAQNDATLSPMIEFYNGTVVDETIIRFFANDLSFDVSGKVLSKDFDGLNYIYEFDNPLITGLIDLNPGVSFTMRMMYGYDTPDGSFLKWDEALQKWIPSAHDYITDTEATEKFLLRRTGSSLLRADLIQMQSYAGADTRIWLSGEVDVRGDKGALSSKRLAVSEFATVGSTLFPFLATLDNHIVTKARMDQAFVDYEPPFVDHPAFHGEFDQVTLKDLLVFNNDGPVAEFRTTGRNLKSFDFTVSSSFEPRGLKKILSINQDRANFCGLTVTNIADPAGPRDAVPLQFIDGRFLTKYDPTVEQTVYSDTMILQQDTLRINLADGTNRILTNDLGTLLTKPKSTRAVGDLTDIRDDELMGAWYTNRQNSQLETFLTSKINTKTEEAPNNGKQYARKNKGWVEVEATSGGGGGTVSGVEEAPTDNKVYVRKNRQWQAQPASTESVNTLPASPTRGTLYLSAGNVLAVGL